MSAPVHQSNVQMTSVHVVTSEPSPHADGYETTRNQLSTGVGISITQSRTPGTPIGVAAFIQGSRLGSRTRGPFPELLISFVSSDLAARVQGTQGLGRVRLHVLAALRLRVFHFRRFLTFVIIPGNFKRKGGTPPWSLGGSLPFHPEQKARCCVRGATRSWTLVRVGKILQLS